MPRIAIAHQLRARMSSMIFSIALVCVPANTTIAQWHFTYAYSGALEDDRVVTRGAYVYYERTAIDPKSGGLAGPTLWNRMRIDNVRDVTINETVSEIHVQAWGVLNRSALILHFTKAQRELARDVARRMEALEYCTYLPMQNRAKIPVISSSVAASPVS